MAQICAVPIFGTSKPEKTRVFFCAAFFWDVKNWIPHTPVGAEWDEFAVGMIVIETFWGGMASI